MSCPLKDAARDSPNQIAIFSKERSMTFLELDRYVDSIKPSFLIQAATNIEVIAQFFAAFRQNRSIFLLSPRLARISHTISSEGVQDGTSSLFSLGRKHCQNDKKSPKEDKDDATDCADSPREYEKYGLVQLPNLKKGPANTLLLYTSGSTGTPKIALLTLKNLLTNAISALPFLDLKPNDLWRLTLPLYHVGGLGIVLRCILARATIALNDHPNITHLSYVPTQLYRSWPIYKNLRSLLLGGAPISNIPKELPIRTTYGLTEMSSMVALDAQILPDRELKLASDGEILVRGPMLFQGYLNENRADWFATGDLGQFKNGKLEILGRKDWMFISGGENIQPEEIEKELHLFPEVIEAVVIPIEDPEFGKRPIAIVSSKSPFSFKQMQERLSQKIPKYKIPVRLHFLDALPQKNGKIDRQSLTKLFISNINNA